MYDAYILFGAIALISYAVSASLHRKFEKYSRLPMSSGAKGKDIASKMLADNGIRNVKVTSIAGVLTDHYNPANNTVNLSSSVYASDSVAAAAVAAHECGHAVQRAVSYPWIAMRSALVPVVGFASQWVQWVLLAGIILLQVFPILLLCGIALFACTTVFSFVTLPVEFDASRRALAWLEKSGAIAPQHRAAAKDALKWAALTYVVAALSSFATLVYYLMIFMNGRRRS